MKNGPGVPGSEDTRPRFRSATLAKGAQVRLKKQYIDGTLTPERAEQVRGGTLTLIDATRFLEVRVEYWADQESPASVHTVWVPWAQVAQVEPL